MHPSLYSCFSRTVAVLALLASGALCAASCHAAIYYYQEDFPNGTTDNLTLSSAGWNAYVGASAANYSAVPAGSGTRVGISWYNGHGSVPGFAFAVPETNIDPTNTFLFSTAEFAPFATSNLSQISWYQHASGENAAFRLAIRIDNNWYVSNASYVNTGSGQTGAGTEFPGEAVLRTVLFSPAASNWRDLTFTAGSMMSLAASARSLDLPAGQLTAAGLFITAPDGTSTRFDLFRIAVPEPSSGSLLAVLVACLGFVGTGRRSRLGRNAVGRRTRW